LRFALGESASLASGVTAAQMPGGLAFVELAIFLATVHASVRVSLERSLSGAIDFRTATATFARTSAAVEACPWHAALARLEVAPCAIVEAGVLHADSSGVAAPAHSTRAWVAVGAGARAAVDVVGPLFVDVGAGLVVPLVRDNYYFAPDQSKVVSRPEVAGLRASLGLGARFW
jgi:hypothetical protein